MKFITALLTLSICSATFAKRVLLVNIYNQQDTDLIEFVADVDDNQKIISIGQVYYKSGSKKPYLVESFGVDDVKKKGVVLSEDSGRKVVVLRATSDTDEYSGGKLILDFMVNGTWNDGLVKGSLRRDPNADNRNQKVIELQLASGPSPFKVVMDGRVIKTMCFHTKKNRIGIVIGVEKITSGKCPKE